MRKINTKLLFTFIFIGAIFLVINDLAQAAPLPCTSPGYSSCINTNTSEQCRFLNDGIYIGPAGCLDVDTSTSGNCCAPEVESCASNLSCASESSTCVSDGGTEQRCQQGPQGGGLVGCCMPDIVIEPCPDSDYMEYVCYPAGSEICKVTETEIQNCGNEGEPGCCLSEEIDRVDCIGDLACRNESECTNANLAFKIGDAYKERCKDGGAWGCCAPEELDEGQINCQEEWGSEDAPYYCKELDSGACNMIGGAHVEPCGGNGAQGCCVPGEGEDEEFYREIERPDPIDKPPNPKIDLLPSYLDSFDLGDQASNIYNVVFIIGVLISVAMIIVSGYSYLTSTGNPEKVSTATQKLTSAVTGAIFIILSLTVLRVIINTLLGGNLGS